MVFDNCVKYIVDEVENAKTFEEWKKKEIILFGIDSLAKTIFHIFKMNNISVNLVDLSGSNIKWAEQKIEKKIDFNTINGDAEFIVTTEKNCAILKNEIERSVNHGEYCINDFSYIRMNKLPNPILPKEYVKTIELRECQLLQLEVMDFFDEFCRKNDLRYFLDYGSLIGAVRHKGFIPWDDDLDVAMPMQDYLKLCKIFPRESQVFFDSIYNERLADLSPSTLTKIKSKKMVVEYNHFPLRTMTGIGIDIFPLCGYPNQLDEQGAYMQEFIDLVDEWKEKVVIPYGTESYDKQVHLNLFLKMQEIATRYDFDESENIGPAYFGYDTFPAKDGTRAMPRAWYDKSIDADFEGRKYSIPVGYDGVLKKWYGNYMQLPPLSDQIALHSTIIYLVDDFEKYE